MQNHLMPTPLGELRRFRAPVTPDSEARWARGGARACLIFVHGFGGRAVGTWGDFADIAMEQPEFADVDLVFLGYESRSRTADFSRAVIYWAVSALASQTIKVISAVDGPKRPDNFSYERIILVGHSLGGALVRDVAMTAKNEGHDWAEKLELALFAPAHVGANAIGLVQMSFGFAKWLGAAQAAALAAYPVLRDLQENSAYLKRLLTMANTIGIHTTTRARFVAHADGDWVVLQDSFFQDPPPLPYANTDHVSCCKPRKREFEQPISDVAGVLP